MNIKKEIEKCKNAISSQQQKIITLQNNCPHLDTRENHYLDYDRNMYSITCHDCGSIVFNGNQFELSEYKKELKI